MGWDDGLLDGLWDDVSVETCENHCRDNERCVYYTYWGGDCIIHGYSVKVAAPVSIENCGDKCVEVVYSVPFTRIAQRQLVC